MATHSNGIAALQLQAQHWGARSQRQGPGWLINRKPKLTKEEVREIVDKGLDPEVDGVVRWRCVDLRGVIRVRPAQIFVAVMGASNFSYAEATRTQGATVKLTVPGPLHPIPEKTPITIPLHDHFLFIHSSAGTYGRRVRDSEELANVRYTGVVPTNNE